MLTNATQDTFVEYDDQRNEHETHFTVPATIGPEDGRHLFSYLGIFLTYITPRDLHVGTTHLPILFHNFIFFVFQYELFYCVLFLFAEVNCILELLKNVFETRTSLAKLIWEVSADATEFFCLFKCRAVLLIQNFLFKK